MSGPCSTKQITNCVDNNHVLRKIEVASTSFTKLQMHTCLVQERAARFKVIKPSLESVGTRLARWYLEHCNQLVPLSITPLLPRIAHFLRDRFVTNYLTICMNHILAVLKIPTERPSGFIALGEMEGALDGELADYLPTIMSHLRDFIAPRKGKPLPEVLACVGSIAKAMGPSMEPHIRSLLDAMFSGGLSSHLVKALEQITHSIPTLLPTIQDRLLDCIAVSLSRSHHSLARTISTGRLNATTSHGL